ncbi:hypothetical protein B0O80DRAFT_494224 [Mortierella sp. GBAus27b]|nr:hypothetical protein B0O80DRAFT_494224 [Mortierella sp. GBAus27b]
MANWDSSATNTTPGMKWGSDFEAPSTSWDSKPSSSKSIEVPQTSWDTPVGATKPSSSASIEGPPTSRDSAGGSSKPSSASIEVPPTSWDSPAAGSPKPSSSASIEVPKTSWDAPVGSKPASRPMEVPTTSWDAPAVAPKASNQIEVAKTSWDAPVGGGSKPSARSNEVPPTSGGDGPASSRSARPVEVAKTSWDAPAASGSSRQQSSSSFDPSVTPWDQSARAAKSPASSSTQGSTSDWGRMAQQFQDSMKMDDQSHTNGSQPRDSYQGRRSPAPSNQNDDVEPTVSIDDVWPGFLEADQSRDFDDVKPALARLCEAFKGSSWSELERKLREEGCNTYLVATEDQVSFGYTLVNLRGEPGQQYRVIPSFIRPGTVKKGRMALGVASTYEENLSRLDNSGVVRPSGIPRCHNCKQEGHTSSSCTEEKREIEKSRNFGKPYGQGLSVANHLQGMQ